MHFFHDQKSKILRFSTTTERKKSPEIWCLVAKHTCQSSRLSRKTVLTRSQKRCTIRGTRPHSLSRARLSPPSRGWLSFFSRRRRFACYVSPNVEQIWPLYTLWTARIPDSTAIVNGFIFSYFFAHTRRLRVVTTRVVWRVRMWQLITEKTKRNEAKWSKKSTPTTSSALPQTSGQKSWPFSQHWRDHYQNVFERARAIVVF